MSIDHPFLASANPYQDGQSRILPAHLGIPWHGIYCCMLVSRSQRRTCGPAAWSAYIRRQRRCHALNQRFHHGLLSAASPPEHPGRSIRLPFARPADAHCGSHQHLELFLLFSRPFVPRKDTSYGDNPIFSEWPWLVRKSRGPARDSRGHASGGFRNFRENCFDSWVRADILSDNFSMGGSTATLGCFDTRVLAGGMCRIESLYHARVGV